MLLNAECSCLIRDHFTSNAVDCTSDYRITKCVVDCLSPALQSLQVAHLMYTITEFQLHNLMFKIIEMQTAPLMYLIKNKFSYCSSDV